MTPDQARALLQWYIGMRWVQVQIGYRWCVNTHKHHKTDLP
jgi:hypothetical protein